MPRNRSKVKVTLCQHAPRLPASLSLITFQFHSYGFVFGHVFSWRACLSFGTKGY